MKKTVFIFPGQGSQFVGMGKDFYENFEVVRKTFDEANLALGYDITKICFEGPESVLMLTENTQPAILTMSTAVLRLLKYEGINCEYTAGLSLGEYTALVNSEVLEFSDAVKLVRNRGIYMQKVVPHGQGKMGAIIGLDSDKIKKIIEAVKEVGIVEIANYNTHDQTVISGEKNAINKALKMAKDLGARKAIPLLVSAPFHSSLLEPAGEMLKRDLDKVKFKDPKTPIITNISATIIKDQKEIYNSLISQVSNSVQWRQSIELLLQEGVTRFVEIGPGTTLANFVKAIASYFDIDVECFSVGDLDSFKKNVKLLKI